MTVDVVRRDSSHSLRDMTGASSKAQLVPLHWYSKQFFFLHGYGRYVCREAQVTLIEFKEKAEKIRAR